MGRFIFGGILQIHGEGCHMDIAARLDNTRSHVYPGMENGAGCVSAGAKVPSMRTSWRSDGVRVDHREELIFDGKES